MWFETPNWTSIFFSLLVFDLVSFIFGSFSYWMCHIAQPKTRGIGRLGLVLPWAAWALTEPISAKPSDRKPRRYKGTFGIAGGQGDLFMEMLVPYG